MIHPNVALPVVARRAAVVRWSSVAYLLTLVVAIALPFESITRPVFEVPGFRLTNLELVIAIALGVGVVALAATIATRRSPGACLRLQGPPTILALPVAVFLLVSLVSAITAPELRVEALKFVGRQTAGAGIFLLASTTAVTLSRFSGFLWAIVLGAGLSALIGLAQAIGMPAFDGVLGYFAAAPTRVGGDLRVNGTFQYATITSMYFEMIVPLALALAATCIARTRRLLVLAILAGAVASVVVTLTRSGLATLAVACGFLLVLSRLRPDWRPFTAPALIAAFTLLGTTGFLMLRADTFQTRLTTENDLSWYGATYRAPGSLSLTTGQTVTVTVEARNTGQATWTATGDHPYALGYRWLSADGKSALDTPHTEVPLPRDVAPGESVQLAAPIETNLPPGRYRLGWSMLQRDILWFRHRGDPEAETSVTVATGHATPDVAAPVAVGPRDERPPVPITIPRGQLWPVAIQMFADRPLLGVGPDNFRLLYGRYLGLETWDSGLHANNLYLEMLADVGLAGTAAFAWLVVAAAIVLVRVLRLAPPGPVALWAAGLSAALLAFLLHGFVDYFLEFTSLYALFWLLLGLVATLPRLQSERR